jgi:gentisate 1,2-dioxygenase
MPGTSQEASAAEDQGIARDRLVAALAKAGITSTRPPIVRCSPGPKPTTIPMHCRWADLEEFLEELGRVVDLRSGGTRLTNPELECGTTPAFWASIQYILPGEAATAHWYTASAFRFVMRSARADAIQLEDQ